MDKLVMCDVAIANQKATELGWLLVRTVDAERIVQKHGIKTCVICLLPDQPPVPLLYNPSPRPVTY